MFEDTSECTCQVIDMSPGGAAIIVPDRRVLGESVVLYLDHIGRLDARIVRHMDKGFAVSIEGISFKKRDKIASQLIWIANHKALCLPEDRRHERYVPDEKDTVLRLLDGRVIPSELIDISISGAAVKVGDDRPDMGDCVVVGQLRGRVVRSFAEGIAVEFSIVQTKRSLSEYILPN